MEVELRDESWVGIRAIEAGDRDALLTGFNRLSDESRYKRFLTPMETLAPSQLAYLTEVATATTRRWSRSTSPPATGRAWDWAPH